MGSRYLLEELNKTEKGMPEVVTHKNQLHEYLQKAGLRLPIYAIDNEGFAHAPEFRCTIFVNGNEYKSRLTYPRRKEAEQDAAELALKSINGDIKADKSTTRPDLIYCKSILNEYAVKKNLKSPQYTTTQEGHLRPVFISTLVFNGKIYMGKVGKSKKEAEQHAAFATVQSLLESSSCGYLHEIVKSKIKISTKLNQANHLSKRESNPSLIEHPEGSSKQVIDIPWQSMSICGWEPTVNAGDTNKRKLVDRFNLGSKKLLREDSLQIVSIPSEETNDKGNDAIYMPGTSRKYPTREKKTKFNR